jgi:hypothetical protein
VLVVSVAESDWKRTFPQVAVEELHSVLAQRGVRRFCLAALALSVVAPLLNVSVLSDRSTPREMANAFTSASRLWFERSAALLLADGSSSQG